MNVGLEPKEDFEAPVWLRELRHDLASVTNALDSLSRSRELELAEPVREIVDLSVDKLYRTLAHLDERLAR